MLELGAYIALIVFSCILTLQNVQYQHPYMDMSVCTPFNEQLFTSAQTKTFHISQE